MAWLMCHPSLYPSSMRQALQCTVLLYPTNYSCVGTCHYKYYYIRSTTLGSGRCGGRTEEGVLVLVSVPCAFFVSSHRILRKGNVHLITALAVPRAGSLSFCLRRL